MAKIFSPTWALAIFVAFAVSAAFAQQDVATQIVPSSPIPPRSSAVLRNPVPLPAEEPGRQRCLNAMETLDQYDFLGAFSAALETTGLAQRLSPTRTPVTLFAPTNQAFASLAEQLGMDGEDLLANTLLVRRILQLHISPAVLTAEGDLFDGRELATFDFGNTITVDFASSDMRATPPGGLPIFRTGKATAQMLPMMLNRNACPEVNIFAIDSVLIPDDIMVSSIDASSATSPEGDQTLSAPPPAAATSPFGFTGFGTSSGTLGGGLFGGGGSGLFGSRGGMFRPPGSAAPAAGAEPPSGLLPAGLFGGFAMPPDGAGAAGSGLPDFLPPAFSLLTGGGETGSGGFPGFSTGFGTFPGLGGDGGVAGTGLGSALPGFFGGPDSSFGASTTGGLPAVFDFPTTGGGSFFTGPGTSGGSSPFPGFGPFGGPGATDGAAPAGPGTGFMGGFFPSGFTLPGTVGGLPTVGGASGAVVPPAIMPLAPQA